MDLSALFTDANLLPWLIPVGPLLAFAIIALFTNRPKYVLADEGGAYADHNHPAYPGVRVPMISDRGRVISIIVGMSGIVMAWLISLSVVFQAGSLEELGVNILGSAIRWMDTGNTAFNLGVMVDPLQVVMLIMVPFACVLIFIYSIGYMANDPRQARFFALISLFAGAMLTLVVADNLLLLFVGWEVMGLCSYQLIGFWFEKPSAYRASIKAFITTRVADVIMLLGIVYLYASTGTLSFREILYNEGVLNTLATTPALLIPSISAASLIGVFLIIGTVGKSAQFPLHVWLPDAMEGPTPVSAMIHAAAMVSAGIYAIIRMFPLFDAGGHAHHGEFTSATMLLAIVGAVTAIFAATIAVAQNDVKKVLAYSTISQLGFMVAALGIGGYIAAAFHLITHAFFKALLFMASGAVIHGMEHGEHHVHHAHAHDDDDEDEHAHGGLLGHNPETTPGDHALESGRAARPMALEAQVEHASDVRTAEGHGETPSPEDPHAHDPHAPAPKGSSVLSESGDAHADAHGSAHGDTHGIHDAHAEHGSDAHAHGGHFDPQDMMNMGGLRRTMPVTFITFLIGGLSLAGFPLLTAGFWSKDEILADAWYGVTYGYGPHALVFVLLAISAFLTAFYTMRQLGLTFWGEPRTEEARHANLGNGVVSFTMTLPLIALSVPALIAGFWGVPSEFPILGGIFSPEHNAFHHFVGPTLLAEPETIPFNWVPLLTSFAVALGGLFVGYLVYWRKPLLAGQPDPVIRFLGEPVYNTLKNKYYFDELYIMVFVRPMQWFAKNVAYEFIDRGVIDGFLHLIARVFTWIGDFIKTMNVWLIDGFGDGIPEVIESFGKRLKVVQSGRVQQYMLIILIVAILIGVAFAIGSGAVTASNTAVTP